MGYRLSKVSCSPSVGSLSPEPKAYSWKRGDYIYIPPFTNHQHVAGDHEECRLIVMSNRNVKEMGFDWFDQVANAPSFDALMKNGGGAR